MDHYCKNCGQKLKSLQIICPSCLYCEFTDDLEKNVVRTGTILTADQLEHNTQWTKYRCGPHGICGHGFAAEDLNGFHDMFHGHTVEHAGRDNSLFGPDRIVDGIQIQTKYCATATKSVDAAFSKTTGEYAYINTETGKPQCLEVPLDQYDECVLKMRQKIIDGKVIDANGNTISDPNEATNIVKKGNYTYQQAKNVAKAGNIDSLKFDFETGSIVAVSAFGLSFAINLSMSLISRDRTGLSLEEAIQMSFLAGLKNGTISMSSHILTTQVLKTTFGRNIAAMATSQSKDMIDVVWNTDWGKDLVQYLAKNILGKDIYGGAAKQVAIKFLRTNAVGQLVVFVVTSIPDTINMLRGKISGPQFVKNLVVASSSLLGGTVGAVLAGRYGNWAALTGGIVGSQTFAWTSDRIARFIHKEDSEKMQKIIKIALIDLANDYLIQSEDEFNECIQAIKSEGAINSDLLRAMYSAGKQDDDDFLRAKIAYATLEYYFDAVIRRRKTMKLMSNQNIVLKYVDSLGKNVIEFKESEIKDFS